MSESKRTYKIVISGGGTGGHIYPAIAIANEIKRSLKDVEILFVGAKNRMEMEKVPAAGYKIEGLWISGIQRNLSKDNLLFPVKVISSVFGSYKILKNFKADIAVGVGGYASWPLLYTASKMGIPTLIQEQNSYAGVTNKFLSRKASKICVAYNGMEKFFPGDKLVVTGNPVRKDIIDLDTTKSQALTYFDLNATLKTVLVIGGSLGARTINQSIASQLNTFKEKNIQLIWQTGKTFYKSACDQVNALNLSSVVKVREFIQKMDCAYAAADIVISRAGALSISELCVAKKPVILVPSPNVAEDHQTKNAKALEKNNAAILVSDSEANNVLVSRAIQLLGDEEAKMDLSRNIGAMAKPYAAEEIVRVIRDILKISDNVH
ncbi:MAG TPA: undecaprenyldiphospho-muramoylpentapeptide beta-N-acetylglucosaminyltransferase [Cytophagaceae bacterium]|jgi:UDP-N-acetylglucosamine--N-acetylmuramyl-(pentapeptide) pyrophosphoryl-undecaprenol N-acetylglucosamine transferase